MEKLRIYLDTSVIGGCFDDEFHQSSNKLFNCFNKGDYIPVVSEIVIAELEGAPAKVKSKFKSLKNIEVIAIYQEMRKLAKKYLHKKIITPIYAGDALHIAVATIIKVDVLVSWNFKHIVNLGKIKQFNSVNLKNDYNILEIRTPLEVIEDD